MPRHPTCAKPGQRTRGFASRGRRSKKRRRCTADRTGISTPIFLQSIPTETSRSPSTRRTIWRTCRTSRCERSRPMVTSSRPDGFSRSRSSKKRSARAIARARFACSLRSSRSVSAKQTSRSMPRDSPRSRSARSRKRLARRGFRSWDVRGMGIATDALASDDRVREAVTEAELDRYAAICARDWDDPCDLRERTRICARREPRMLHFFLAEHGTVHGSDDSVVRR